MTVINILMAPQYLNNNHVLRNNVSRRSIVPCCLHAEQWYVIITFDVTWTAGITNKLPGAGIQTSYVHSSIINE